MGNRKVRLRAEKLKKVIEFTYLEYIVSADRGIEGELKHRIGSSIIMGGLSSLWGNSGITMA